jgi:hypothetical protein
MVAMGTQGRLFQESVVPRYTAPPKPERSPACFGGELQPGSRLAGVAEALEDLGNRFAEVALEASVSELGNTDTENSLRILHVGFDWLDLSCYVSSSDPDNWERWQENLRFARDKAREGGESKRDAFVWVAGSPFHIKPQGHGVGVCFFPWVGQWRGMTVKVGKREHSTRGGVSSSPNLQFEIPGHCWLTRSIPQIMRDVRDFLAGIGVEPNDIAPTRVDLAIDVAGQNLHKLALKVAKGQYVSRSRKVNWYQDRGRVTGVEVVSREVRYVAYDKLYERKKKGGDEGLKEYVDMRCGGIAPKSVVRHEFKLRKNVLERHGIRTLETLLAKTSDVLAWLMSDWLRFTTIRPSKNNTARAKASKEWAALIDAALSRIPVCFRADDVKPKSAYCLRRAVKILHGNAVNVAVAAGFDPRDLPNLFLSAYYAADKFTDELDTASKVMLRRDTWLSEGKLE